MTYCVKNGADTRMLQLGSFSFCLSLPNKSKPQIRVLKLIPLKRKTVFANRVPSNYRLLSTPSSDETESSLSLRRVSLPTALLLLL